MNKCTNLKPIQSLDENQDSMNETDAHLTVGVSDNADNNSANNQPTIIIEDEKNDKNANDNDDGSEVDSSIGSTTSLNNAINSEPSPSDSNSIQNQDDTKSSSTTSSAQYSMTDNSEKSDSKRTLLNKYVKKPWKTLMNNNKK